MTPSSPFGRLKSIRVYRQLLTFAVTAFLIFQQLVLVPWQPAQAASTTIVISEVDADPPLAGTDTANEWIELHNIGATTITLTNWTITDNVSSDVIPTVTLGPGGHVIIAGTAAGFASEHPGFTGTVLAITDGGIGNGLANGGDQLILKDSGGTTIDALSWGTNTTVLNPAPPADAATNTNQRNAAGTDTDTAADWSRATQTPNGTTNAPSSTNPSGTGGASLNPVAWGDTTRLTVTVTPGTNPPSVTHTVTANLSSIGGSSSQQFFDNGTNGDLTPLDNVFSYNATIPNGTSGGVKSLPFTIQETAPLTRTGTGSISLTVQAPTNPSGTGSASPSSVLPGESSLLTVNVTPGTNPTSTGLAVTANLTSIGGSATQAFSGSGNTFTYTATVAMGTTPGPKTLPVQITDAQGRSGSTSISLTVQSPPAGDVVISQIYGGGGNTGSTLKNDFIELINHGSTPVSLNGWSVQVFSTTLNAWEVTPLTNFTLQPGQYYLIQESQGAGGTDNLPTPDATGTILVSSTAGRVALVSNTTTLTGGCPTGSAIVDFVGYGTATTCFEGAGPAPQLSNTTAAQRRNEGCFDTDDNAADFVSGGPTPRNSSASVHDCTGLSAYGSANPSTVPQGSSTTLTVYVAPAQNPDSSGITVTGDLSSIGGSPSQSFTGSGNVFTFVATVPANNPPGMKSLPVTVADGQGRTTSTNILVSVLSTTPDHVTISQVYGGGGNMGATYANDYVELYNPTAAPISMTGWSLQYSPATGTTFTGKTVLGGSIDPGHYYLIKLASGGATGAPLPPASVTGDINMATGAGKIVLVSNTDTLIGPCPVGSDSDIVDFVGYGTTANCHEGSANAPAPSNTTAIFRKTNGGTDTDQNGNDFLTGVPNPRSTTPVVEFGPSVAGTDPSTNSTTAPYDSTITVDFSEPVDAVGAWYNITCTNTGLHNDATVAHSNDFETWAVTPNTSFQFGEQCTVTINKNQIHDQDLDDSGPDTDTLAADYVWSFTVVLAGQPAPYAPTVHLTMGNPSNATASISDPNNYLMEKPTYSVSYNRDKGTPNWVSWHLDSSWYGTLTRVDTFRPDPAVDPSWYRVQAFDYSGSGFDRGHMTPNADRDNQNRIPINQETYLMSNMLPQSPDNNQGPWANLEAYLRTQADANNEIYIVAGGAGVGGTGSNGSATTIANGHVTVPAQTWKVALIIPKADSDDVSRVTCGTRTLAVIMPNIQGIRNDDWQNYIVSVDQVETLTGYDFFSNLPDAVENCVEAGVNGSNPPGTEGQSVSTNEDTPVDIHLTAASPNNNPLTYTIVSGPSHGVLTGTGADRTYTPNANYFGPDSFTFKVNDGAHDSNTSTVNITVNSVNDNPDAVDDGATVAEDSGANTITVLANDTDTENDTLSVTSVTQGSNGSVTNNGSSVSYTPNANFFGTDSFTYTISDGNGGTDTATVNVTVNNVNDNPTAGDDAATVAEDSGANTIDVLANDSFAPDAGETLTITSVTQGTNGSVTNNGNSVSYTPNANFVGTDSFTYTISDGNGGSATATVNVTVTNVNDPPTAGDDSATVGEDSGANAIDVLANDSFAPDAGETLSVSAKTDGAHGTVTITGGGTGLTYTPNANFFGTDTFTYTVSDGNGGTDTATVTVNVNNVNDPPDAVDDGATVAEDSGANAINVLGNDTAAPDTGETLTITAVTQGAHGSVAITGGGTGVSYTPAANYFGTDSFSYTISDGNGGTDTANVSVNVTNINDAPVAAGDGYVTNSNTTLNVPAPGVLSNDTDIDGPSLSAQLVSNVSHGTLVLNADGSFSYAPALNFTGTDSFTYQASDGMATSNVATVTIVVNDTVAPTLNASVAINSLWPPNHDLINVGLAVSATDNSGGPVTTQVFVFSNQDDLPLDGSGQSPDAKDIAPGTLRLRAERTDEARIYLILVVATDASGNTSRNCLSVVVPKNNSQNGQDELNQQAEAARAQCAATGVPPAGYFVVGDGPVVGSKQ